MPPQLKEYEALVQSLSANQRQCVRVLIDTDNGRMGFPTLARCIGGLTEAERHYALVTLTAEGYSPFAD